MLSTSVPVVFFVICILWRGTSGQLSEISHSFAGPSGSTFKTASLWPNYQLAAYTDLNADRAMDVILLDPDGRQIFASIAPSSRSSLTLGADRKSNNLPSPTSLLTPGLSDPIRSLVPADFNGDSLVDLLILTSSSPSGPFAAHIAYGDKGDRRGLFVFDKREPIATFTSQPLVCDLNADSVADIFGQVKADSRLVILGGKNLSQVELRYNGPNWSSLGYSAFGDLNGDTIPDIVLLVDNQGKKAFQLILRNTAKLLALQPTSLIDLPDVLRNAPHLTLGLFVLADFDLDGQIELLLPACTSSDCHGSSYLFMYNFRSQKWTSLDVSWIPKGQPAGSDWSLAPTPSSTGSELVVSSLVGPAVGDVNLDGKQDIAVGLSYRSGSKSGVFPAILLNEGLNASSNSLKFQAYLLPGAELPEDDKLLRQISVFYNGEKGTLDVFAVTLNPTTKRPTVALLLQQMTNDFYFIKVTVLNGLCKGPESCPDDRLPYGLPVPGQGSSYTADDSSGSKISSVGLITTQSCCSSLQLPSVLYGLGPFANYVERLTVFVPPNSSVQRSLSIPALIPNSEVFVNPYPLDDPYSWTAKLFLQPLYNMKVLYIAITLIAVCIVLIIIISILLCLEVREDRAERQREAQRFHFDAM